MCGIVGYTGGREAAPFLLSGLRALEYRGYDSAGLAVMGEAGLELAKTGGRAALPGRSGIGHTRWATHGAPTDVNAHPHVSCGGRFAVVHNGIIENYAALRAELTALGCSFRSETDTEVIAHLLELGYDGDFREALMRTVARLEGSYALGVVCTDFPGEVYAVREASPLILGLGAGENCFASDLAAIAPYTKSAVRLEDGQFARLRPEGVQVYDFAGRPVEPEIFRVDWGPEAAEKGGWEHFMLKEIMEQPGRASGLRRGAGLRPAGAARLRGDNGLRLRLLRGLRGEARHRAPLPRPRDGGARQRAALFGPAHR